MDWLRYNGHFPKARPDRQISGYRQQPLRRKEARAAIIATQPSPMRCGRFAGTANNPGKTAVGR
jgi:hypothetical protein